MSKIEFYPEELTKNGSEVAYDSSKPLPFVDLKDAVLEMPLYVAYKEATTRQRKYEENDGISETVQSDWIPIGEQVKMIMRGEITVGNMSDGYDDAYTDLEEESPDEVFEDATDYGTEYSDELRDAVLATGEQKQANDSAETDKTNDVSAQAKPESEQSEE